MRARVWHRPGQGRSAERGHPRSGCALTDPVLRLSSPGTGRYQPIPSQCRGLLKMTGAVAGLENKETTKKPDPRFRVGPD